MVDNEGGVVDFNNEFTFIGSIIIFVGWHYWCKDQNQQGKLRDGSVETQM